MDKPKAIGNRSKLEEILQVIEKVRSGKCEREEQTSMYLNSCKATFDLHKESAGLEESAELYVDGLDPEQVWQQSKMYEPRWKKASEEARKSRRKEKKLEQTKKEAKEEEEVVEEDAKEDGESEDETVNEIIKRVRFSDDTKGESDDEMEVDSNEEGGGEGEEEEDGEEEGEDEEEGDEEEDDDETERKPKRAKLELPEKGYEDPLETFKKAIKRTNADGGVERGEASRFFSESKMKEFLDREDAIEMKGRDYENEDEEEEDEDEDEDAGYKYEDFFDPPSDVEVAETEPAAVSSFEKRTELIKKRVSQLEDKSVAEKPWLMRGEVGHEDRPLNSLIENELEFQTNDVFSRRSVFETEEDKTKYIEDVIVKRFESGVWDGPKRKVRQKEKAFTFNSKVVLDQEKSKLSLAEVYEQEYLDQMKEKEDEIPPQIQEIQRRMKSLFAKLDALSNFTVTPMPAIPDIKVVCHEPAANVEEVAPIVMTEAMALAPEEVVDKRSRGLTGVSEMTKTDKKRNNRLRKKKQHFVRVDKESREKMKKLREEKRTMHKSETDSHLKSKEIKKSGRKRSKRTKRS